MQLNQDELKTKLRKLTYQFAAVGWLAAALTTGAMFSFRGTQPFMTHLKQFAFLSGYMAAISLIPLLISTHFASRWIFWIVVNEDREKPTYTKYCYAALITILIAVGGAGLLVMLGSFVFTLISGGLKGLALTMTSGTLKNAVLMLLLGAGCPLIIGAWIEIPMMFFYGYLVRKLVQASSRLPEYREGPSVVKSTELLHLK